MAHTWQPTREAAYRVIDLVKKGNCAAQIAQTLFRAKTPTELMRVRRLLEVAEEMGVIAIRCPTNEQLEKDLAARFGSEITFSVVNNDHVIRDENSKVEEKFRADALCRQGAQIVAKKIAWLLREKGHRKKRIVIANAGGYAVSKVVSFLSGQKLLAEESDIKKLLFISLNIASIPTAFGLSANTCAVRMADIYGSAHIAISSIWPKEVREDYEQAVRDIDLLICGAGTKHSLLFTWLKDHVRIELPKGAVGDICLIPVSAKGDEVPLEKTGPQLVSRHLQPSPTYADLQAVAGRDGVVLIPTGYQLDDQPVAEKAGSGKVHSKLEITRAVLERGLARTCVLGATLARDLLEATNKPDA